MKVNISDFFDAMESSIEDLDFRMVFYDSKSDNNIIKVKDFRNEDIEGFRKVFGDWLAIKSVSFDEEIVKIVVDFRDIIPPLNKITIKDFCDIYEGNITKFCINDKVYTPIEAKEKCGDQIIERFIPVAFDNLVVFRLESESEQ